MKRLLIRSPTFVRAAKRVVKKQPHLTEDIRTALTMLVENANHPRLKVHKLKGKLDEFVKSPIHPCYVLCFKFYDKINNDKTST